MRLLVLMGEHMERIASIIRTPLPTLHDFTQMGTNSFTSLQARTQTQANASSPQPNPRFPWLVAFLFAISLVFSG